MRATRREERVRAALRQLALGTTNLRQIITPANMPRKRSRPTHLRDAQAHAVDENPMSRSAEDNDADD